MCRNDEGFADFLYRGKQELNGFQLDIGVNATVGRQVFSVPKRICVYATTGMLVRNKIPAGGPLVLKFLEKVGQSFPTAKLACFDVKMTAAVD